jgi:hypothetical protein
VGEYVQVVALFADGKQVEVEGIKYTINPVLTCDLKVLMKMLGLKNVFHPSAKWRCPYCAVSKRYYTEHNKKDCLRNNTVL